MKITRTLAALFLINMIPAMSSATVSIYVTTPSPRIPVGGIQSLTAVVNGTTNKAVNWSTTCGTLIGGTDLTVGLKSTTVQNCVVTAAAAADVTQTQTVTVHFEATRPDLQAANIHPRIGLTPADVSSNIVKVANAGNVVYNSGMAVYMAGRANYYDAVFCYACTNPGPILPGSTVSATAWVTDSFGNTTFTTASQSFTNGAGFVASGFASGSCFNGQILGVETGPPLNPFTLVAYTGCPAGSATESGTITPSLNGGGWIDNVNGFEYNGGGPFSEDVALFAWMSLHDPVTGNRATWAMKARAMMAWLMREYCYNAYTGTGACVPRSYSGLGGNSGVSFIGSQVVLNNYAQNNLVAQIQAIDWNYASFTTADKAVIAQVLHIWGQQLTGANPLDVTSGGNEHVNPVGAYNTPIIFDASLSAEEGGSNNYSLGHWQTMAAIGILLDAADDPVVSSCATSTTTICASDGSAQTVAAYGVYAVKGWLYRLYANFEDQKIVAAALGVANPDLCPDLANAATSPPYNTDLINCTGSMSGGFPGEGTGYGVLSMSEMVPTLYNLYLAGKLDPTVDPQASFISSSYFDKLAWSLVYQLEPDTSGSGGCPYIPFSNDQNGAVGPTQPRIMSALEVYASQFGTPGQVALNKWYMYNCGYGGPTNFFGRFLGSVQPGSGGTQAGGLFIANTIAATSATNDGDFSTGEPVPNAYDPRNISTLPLDFENLPSAGGLYRYYGRDSWNSTATVFNLGSNTSAQDHAMQTPGSFALIFNGEPLSIPTGGTTNNNGLAQAPSYQSIPGYQWNPTADCTNAGFDEPVCTEGGPVGEGYGQYSNLVLAASSASAYMYGVTDMSGAYTVNFDNCAHCAEFLNVNRSQRRILWIKPGLAFTYDGVNTTSTTSFVTWNLNTQNLMTGSGPSAAMISTAGQMLYVTSILPGTSTFTASTLSPAGVGSPNLLQDAVARGGSQTTNMLHTIEAKASGAASSTALVVSSFGTAYDGARVGTTLVMFKRNQFAATFTSTSFPASGATSFYVDGLVPNSSYPITGAGTPTTVTADPAGVAAFTGTGTGTITVGSGTPPPSVDGFKFKGGKIRGGLIK